ncbi:flagellar export protein FliJ [Niallia taxi]|nr:flagellar export protein FliJ [Niallia taxi]MDE5051496.1 flagellar export protein FliJ [Niallia taxi]
MSYKFKFEKILTIKEREKDEASTDYNLAVKRFEDAAEKLYELLKRKEELEEYQSNKLVGGLSVQAIRHHQHFISNLAKMIEHSQQMVVNARNSMNYYQQKLVDKNLEVKKFVKIKEKDILHFINTEKALEAKQMDDISIQQYMQPGRLGS